jgi:hypothetical protein
MPKGVPTCYEGDTRRDAALDNTGNHVVERVSNAERCEYQHGIGKTGEKSLNCCMRELMQLHHKDERQKKDYDGFYCKWFTHRQFAAFWPPIPVFIKLAGAISRQQNRVISFWLELVSGYN